MNLLEIIQSYIKFNGDSDGLAITSSLLDPSLETWFSDLNKLETSLIIINRGLASSKFSSDVFDELNKKIPDKTVKEIFIRHVAEKS